MLVSNLRDWFLYTAMGCVLYSAGLVSPVLALPAVLFFSFPPAVLAFERGMPSALSSAFCSSLIMETAFGGGFGPLCFCASGLPGIMMGTLARSPLKGGDMLVAAGAAQLSGKLAGILMFHYFSGINLMAPSADMVEKLTAFYGSAALNREIAREAVERAVLLTPYGIILFSSLEALFCLMLISHIHKRKTGKTVYFPPPFREWRFPGSVLFALAVGFVCAHVPSGGVSHLTRQIGVNLSELSRTMFILQGLSCAYFFMERRGVAKPLRLTVILMTPLMPFLPDILAIVGVTDMGFNLRKRTRGI